MYNNSRFCSIVAVVVARNIAPIIVTIDAFHHIECLESQCLGRIYMQVMWICAGCVDVVDEGSPPRDRDM